MLIWRFREVLFILGRRKYCIFKINFTIWLIFQVACCTIRTQKRPLSHRTARSLSMWSFPPNLTLTISATATSQLQYHRNWLIQWTDHPLLRHHHLWYQLMNLQCMQPAPQKFYWNRPTGIYKGVSPLCTCIFCSWQNQRNLLDSQWSSHAEADFPCMSRRGTWWNCIARWYNPGLALQAPVVA